MCYHLWAKFLLLYQKGKQCYLDGTEGESKTCKITEAGNNIGCFISDIIAVIFDNKNPLKLGFEMHINVAIGLCFYSLS